MGLLASSIVAAKDNPCEEVENSLWIVILIPVDPINPEGDRATADVDDDQVVISNAVCPRLHRGENPVDPNPEPSISRSTAPVLARFLGVVPEARGWSYVKTADHDPARSPTVMVNASSSIRTPELALARAADDDLQELASALVYSSLNGELKSCEPSPVP